MASFHRVPVWLCLLLLLFSYTTSADNNKAEDRKLFGGYRIVPKRCIPNSEHESARTDGDVRRMICMFNYECTARNGDVVGACMDGFLFGACCRLPPGQDIEDPVVTPELIVSVTDNAIPVDEHPAPRPPMISHLTDLLHDPGLHVSSHPDADTVLIQYPLNSTMRPPELSTFSYVGSHKEPAVNSAPAPASTPKSSSARPTTTSHRMPTSTYYTSRWPTTPIAFRLRPSSTSASTEYDEDDDNLVKVPIITSPGASSTEIKRPDNDVNPESISHIISILNDTNGGLVDPGPEPQPEIIDHSPPMDMSSTAGLSTWVSLNGSPSAGTSSERPGGFTVSMSKHPMSTTMYASMPSRYPSPFTSSSTSSHHIIGPTYDVMTTQQASRPAPTVIVLGPLATSSETTMDTTTVTRRPIITSSTTHGGFYITKRPTTSKPTVYTPIVTKKPTTLTKPTTLITKLPWEQTTSSIFTKPPTTGTTIVTKKPWISIPTTTMEYPEVATVVDVNFPPVRNPQFNMSSQHERPPLPPNPEDIYEEAVAAQEEADIPTPSFMEDDKLNMKLHSFVNKIVQSLEGNFQDLEDIVYKRPNASTPLESSSTTRRPVPTTSKRPFTTRRPTNTTPTRKPTTARPQGTRPVAQSTARPTQTSKPSKPTRPTLRPLTNRPTPTSRPQTSRPTPTSRPQTSRPSQTARPAQTARPTQSSKPTRPQSARPSQTARPGQTSRPTSRPVQSTTVKTSSRPTPSRRPTTTRRPVTKRSTTTSSQQLITQETTKTTPSKTSVTKGEAITSTEESITLADAIDFTTEPAPTTTSTTAKPVNYKNECGVRPLMSKKTGRIVGGKGATFGAWPWQVLVRESTWLGLFTKNKCGGVLITSRFVITAAHCQPGFLANLVAVLGEYDLSGELESRRSVTRNVRRVIVHRQYDAATFANDLALLELESPVAFDEHIVPICMPRETQDFTGRMATVTGWGRLKYGGGVPSVLQEVQVPVIENSVCQEMFNTAGHTKVILNSFLCAGYANGQKDSCEGDSGGPLMMERDDGRWVLIGTVSHGIKCAAPYLPGVYMRTTYYKPWLSQITGVK